MPRPKLPFAALWFALVAALALNLILFRTPLYRAILAPDSSAGSFERALAALRTKPSDPRHDVLVLGDSRIFEGLDPATAARAAGGGLHFVRAAVPGTTPRCWTILARRIDPEATRYRALVIPVDTLGDDDSAIGSIDGDDREQDLHYLVFSVRLGEIGPIARSFGGIVEQTTVAANLALRGPLLRDDIRALLADPAGRFHDLESAPQYDLDAPRAAFQSLRGLKADFANGTLSIPAGVSAGEQIELARQILPVALPSVAYARYREEWLGPLVEAYRHAGRPVIFVRIPTRPIHRPGPSPALGTLGGFEREGAVIVGAAPYLALEQPRYFRDHDHLDRAGSELFSIRFGRDVARAIGR